MGKGHAKNEDTLLAKGTANEISANTITHYFNTLFLNSALTMFRVMSASALTIQKMIDGIVDEFEDETGIDTVNSINEYYASECYSVSSALDSDTKFLSHLNIDPIIDEMGTCSVALNDAAEIDLLDSKFGAGCLRLPNCKIDDAVVTGLDFSANPGGAFTLDFWFKSSDMSGDYRGLVTCTDSGVGWQLNLMSGKKFHFPYYGQSPNNWYQIYSDAFASTLLANTWYHFEISFDTQYLRFFVNGALIGSPIDLTSHLPLSYTIPSMLLTNPNAPTGEHKYDEIRFSRTVRHTTSFSAPTDQYTGIALNMTLYSIAQSAEAVPSEGRIILFEEDTDVITENTDLKAYISRDNGTTYTQVTLVDEGGYDSSRRILAGTVDISSQPSGTNMKYKITTHNNKSLKLHGVSLFWK